MKTFVALAMFLLLIGQLTAEQSVELEEVEGQEVEKPLHNLIKRSASVAHVAPVHFGFKATGKVKVGGPVVLKAPVFKQLTTYFQDGFKYIFPNRCGNLRGGYIRGGNFNCRAGGYPYGYYPNEYQFQGGYPYGPGGGYPYGYDYQYPTYYQGGYPYGPGGGYPYGYDYQYPTCYQGGYPYGYTAGNQYPDGKGGYPYPSGSKAYGKGY